MRCRARASNAAASPWRCSQADRRAAGIRRFFRTYPFICLEQKVSKAVGLRDAALWAEVSNALPTYLDSDGLANYFRRAPGRCARQRYSAHRLPDRRHAQSRLRLCQRPRATRCSISLVAFVEGRIERKFWSPVCGPGPDVRKIAALEALSRHGRAQPKDARLPSTSRQPVADGGGDRLAPHPAARRRHPERAKRMEEAQQILPRAPDVRRHTLPSPAREISGGG